MVFNFYWHGLIQCYRFYNFFEAKRRSAEFSDQICQKTNWNPVNFILEKSIFFAMIDVDLSIRFICMFVWSLILVLPLTGQNNNWDSGVIICNCSHNNSFVLIFLARWVSLKLKLTEKHKKKFYRSIKVKLLLYKFKLSLSLCCSENGTF